jgi:hypothetical protein
MLGSMEVGSGSNLTRALGKETEYASSCVLVQVSLGSQLVVSTIYFLVSCGEQKF